MPIPVATTPAAMSFSSSSIFVPSTRISLKPPLTLSTHRRPAAVLTIRSSLASLPVLSFSGEQVGEAQLDLKSASPDTARAVVHRGLVTDLRNKRSGTASTLTRAEVSGGGRKPYPQKKTGGARRGSQRTPLRPGGGVIFGPKPKDWSVKMNRKEKRLALSTAIASAAAAEDAIIVEDLDDQFKSGPKTREFVEALKRWGLDPTEKATFFMLDVPENVRLSSRNIGTLKVLTPRTLNIFDVLDAKKLVFTRAAVDYLNSIYGADSGETDEEEEDGDEEGEEAN